MINKWDKEFVLPYWKWLIVVWHRRLKNYGYRKFAFKIMEGVFQGVGIGVFFLSVYMALLLAADEPVKQQYKNQSYKSANIQSQIVHEALIGKSENKKSE